jgi:hypothetical protein
MMMSVAFSAGAVSGILSEHLSFSLGTGSSIEGDALWFFTARAAGTAVPVEELLLMRSGMSVEGGVDGVVNHRLQPSPCPQSSRKLLWQSPRRSKQEGR